MTRFRRRVTFFVGGDTKKPNKSWWQQQTPTKCSKTSKNPDSQRPKLSRLLIFSSQACSIQRALWWFWFSTDCFTIVQSPRLLDALVGTTQIRSWHRRCANEVDLQHLNPRVRSEGKWPASHSPLANFHKNQVATAFSNPKKSPKGLDILRESKRNQPIEVFHLPTLAFSEGVLGSTSMNQLTGHKLGYASWRLLGINVRCFIADFLVG